MNKTSRKAYNAFKNKREFTSHNTKVRKKNEEMHMYLFGNEIAKTENGETWISDGNYRPTVTTRNRLDEFVYIRLCKGYFIINEKFKWDGKWLNVSKLNNN